MLFEFAKFELELIECVFLIDLFRFKIQNIVGLCGDLSDGCLIGGSDSVDCGLGFFDVRFEVVDGILEPIPVPLGCGDILLDASLFADAILEDVFEDRDIPFGGIDIGSDLLDDIE